MFSVGGICSYTYTVLHYANCYKYIDHQTGWSALMAAVYKSHKDVALRLIEAGAIPHIQDAVSQSLI